MELAQHIGKETVSPVKHFDGLRRRHMEVALTLQTIEKEQHHVEWDKTGWTGSRAKETKSLAF
jgi:hypothetical protein